MANRELTDKQQLFLEVLFEEAGGDFTKAKKLAGYADKTRASLIVEGIKDEIIEATKDYLIYNTPQAAATLTGVLTDRVTLGVKDKITVAKDIMDRAGLLKTENINVSNSGGVMILPPKKPLEDEDED